MMQGMKRRWNLILPAGFFVTVAAFLSYFMFFARFPVTRDFPWVNLILFALGLALLGVGIRRAYGEPSRYRGKISGPVLGTLGVLIFGLFLVYNFWLSRQLPAATRAPSVGEKAPDFALPDTQGAPVTLSKLFSGGPGRRDQWVLLVFYRGYW